MVSLLRVVSCLFAKGFPRFPYDTNFISKFETYISNFEMLVSAAEILISRAEMKHGTRGRKKLVQAKFEFVCTSQWICLSELLSIPYYI